MCIRDSVYRYRENDFRPYVFQTNDYGASWELLTDGSNGIPETNFVRAVREDPVRRGLLFAGTEFGMYVSFDDGAHWQDFQMELPVTPVTDMLIHRGDLVLATQGRGFWVMEDISVLRGLTAEVADAQAWVFAPRTSYRGLAGSMPRIHYWLAGDAEGELSMEILDAGGNVIHETTARAGQRRPPAGGGGGGFGRRFGGGGRLTAEAGHHIYTWNMREEGPEIPSDVTLWGGAGGRTVLPGAYTVRMTMGEWTQEQPLTIELNPRLEVTIADLQAQYDMLGDVGERIDRLYDGLATLREVKKQSMEAVARVEAAGQDASELEQMAKSMAENLTAVEEQLTQVKSKSNQDPINFPPMLDNQFVELYGYVSGGWSGGGDAPPAGAYQRLQDLDPQLDELLGQLQAVIDSDLAAFNATVSGMNVPAIVVKSGEDEM